MTLRVHPGQRYLQTSDGRPFCWLGDTAWELFHRCDRDEAAHYLDVRAEQGFNLVQAVALAELDGLRVPNPYGEVPLHDLDPTRPNEAYFAHVDWIVREANARGITIGFLPTWGDKWEPQWGVGPLVFTPANARVYGRWLGARYRGANLVWILGGDRPVADEHKLAIIRAMAEGLREGDGGAHLCTLHPCGGESSSRSVHAEAWLDFHMIQSGHSRDRHNHALLSHDWSLLPRRPVVEGEPGYECHPNQFNPENGWLDHHDVRREFYWAWLSGAAGFTYGCHAIWQMWKPGRHPINHPRASWMDSLPLPGARQLGHGRRLLESRPFFGREPAQEVIKAGQRPGIEEIRAIRDRDGSHAFVYVPGGQRCTIDTTQLGGPAVRAWWFNPRTGAAIDLGRQEKAAAAMFQCPYDHDGRDWVLVLDNASRDFGPPGSAIAPGT